MEFSSLAPGPSALILAYELLRRGVPVRLVEKRKGSFSTTHARSMEMFDHMSIGRRLKEVCVGEHISFPGTPLIVNKEILKKY